MITSVWSSYGHRFMSTDDERHDSCLTCGAMYELIETPQGISEGAYVASNGDEPMQCTQDTSMVHGYAGEIDGEPHPDCNCLFCR